MVDKVKQKRMIPMDAVMQVCDDIAASLYRLKVTRGPVITMQTIEMLFSTNPGPVFTNKRLLEIYGVCGESIKDRLMKFLEEKKIIELDEAGLSKLLPKEQELVRSHWHCLQFCDQMRAVHEQMMAELKKGDAPTTTPTDPESVPT